MAAEPAAAAGGMAWAGDRDRGGGGGEGRGRVGKAATVSESVAVRPSAEDERHTAEDGRHADEDGRQTQTARACASRARDARLF